MEAQDFVAALIGTGMTQAQIEARTGIRQATVSKVLRGDVKDVLSVNYRKLQALYAEVCAPPADERVADRGRGERSAVGEQVAGQGG